MIRTKDVFNYDRTLRSQEPIREPLQERSRKNVDRIMVSLESLLEKKSFDRITMAELARESGVGISSIYARFSDKSALILGMHLRLREGALQCLDELTDPTRWKGATVDDIVRRIILNVVRFYRKHRFLIRAALFVDDTAVRERQGSVLRIAAEKFTLLFIAPKAKAANKIGIAVDFSVKMVASVMYAEIMFGSVELTRTPMPDRRLVARLSSVILALLFEAGVGRT